jgi:hypothetical protein
MGCLWLNQQAFAHGSVVAEEDLCIIKIGFYTAHFTVFQPLTREHVEYCEDLPDVSESVFVMEYLHDSMRDVPVDFRIVVDRNNVGRFASIEDLEQLDPERDTVFYQRAVRQADGVLVARHEFAQPGNYIGVVTATNPTQDKVYTAVFPFQVGGIRWGYVSIVAVIAAFVTVVGIRRWRQLSLKKVQADGQDLR